MMCLVTTQPKITISKNYLRFSLLIIDVKVFLLANSVLNTNSFALVAVIIKSSIKKLKEIMVNGYCRF